MSTFEHGAPRRRTGASRLLLTIWTLSLGAAVAGVGVVGGRAQTTGAVLREVASSALPESIAGEKTMPLLDPVARRVIVPCDSCGPSGDPDAVVYEVFDADTMNPVGAIRRGTSGRAFLAAGSAVDPDHGRIFDVAGNEMTSSAQDPGNNALESLYAVDTHKLTIVGQAPLTGLLGYTVGLHYSSHDHLLYAVGANAEHNGTVTSAQVMAIDPLTEEVLWSSGLGTKCYRPSQNWQQTVLGEVTMGGSSYLYTVCQIQPFSSAEGVVRITLPSHPAAASGTLTLPVDAFPGIVAGNGGGTDSVFIPSSGRLVTTVSNADNSAVGVYVFDPATTSFVSAPTLFNRGTDRNVSITQPSLGVDPVSGRIYASAWMYAGQLTGGGSSCESYVPSSSGFALAEGNLDSNASTFVPLADQTFEATGAYAATFDPRTRNVWVLDHPRDPSQPCKATTAYQHTARLVVLHDDSTPAGNQAVRNWDAGTQDVGSASAVGFSATAQASAYGVQYDVSPTGVDGLLSQSSVADCRYPDTTFAGFAGVAAAAHLHWPSSPPLPAQYHAICNSNPREVTFARVTKTSVDASEASAEAVAGDANGGTARDAAVATDGSQPAAFPTTSVGYVAGLCQVADITASQCSIGAVTEAVCRQDGIDASACTVGAIVAKGCADHGIGQATSAPNGSADPARDSARALCSLALPYLTGEQMPFTPSPCSDNGTSPQVPGERHADAPTVGGAPFTPPGHAPGWSEVTCSYAGAVAEGQADADSASLGLPVSVQSAYAGATSQRDTANGSEARADSVVTGIDVFGVLHIGRLEVHSTTRAYGRAGSNAASYSCTVSDVAIDLPGGTESVPGPPPVPAAVPLPTPTPPPATPQLRIPGTASCSDPNLRADLDQLNQQLQGTLQVDLPQPVRSTDSSARDDEVVVRVSPRGYLAEIAPSTVRANQDEIILGERTIEEPAMVVTYIGDTGVRHSRFVTRLGGVAASSRYGLFPLDDGGSAGGDGATGPIPPTPDTGVAAVVQPQAAPAPSGAAAPPTAPGGDIGGLLHRVAQAIVEGINVLLQHPGLIPPLLACWAMLGLPGYLVNRRRVLLDTTGGR